ncbi:MAG: cystathionine gamma-lyase [Sphingomonadaceae bacterium]|nr:cystathionine gamma-lyase [Sphingomonadaceae bacterium]
MAVDLGKIVAEMLHRRGAALSPGDPIAPPIVMASQYWLPASIDAPHQYGRWTNPSWSAVQDALSGLEDAEAIAFPSGMAAIAAALVPLLKAGDRILLPSDGYAATRRLAETYLAPLGVTVDLCATAECAERDLSGTTHVLVETPSNPGLDLCDLRRVAANAKTAGALMVVDNTVMTPLGQRPLDLGADIVVSSDTKALGGHSDLIFGHAATRDAVLATKLREWRTLSGAVPGPFEAWLAHRGLETLELRFDRMCATAELIAARLTEHWVLEAVRFPGLADHPGHALARGQMLRFGNLIGLTFADAARAEGFIAAARFLAPATSFGGVHSSAERRARWGDAVPEGYIRLSIGCEPAEALWADLAAALTESGAERLLGR